MRRLAALLLTTVSLTGIGGVTTGAPATAASTCQPWHAQQVAKGFGILENLSFDGTGGLLLSEQKGKGAIVRLTADGSRSTVVPNAGSPGGQVVDGRTLYFTTGNGIADGVLGLLGQAGGGISSVDLDTGTVSVVARDLTMPNGMIRLPDGSFLVSRDLGLPGRTTRVFPDGHTEVFAPSVTSTNGMAYDAARGAVYIDSTFNLATTISVVDLQHPAATPRVITIPGLGPANSADDLTLGADGRIYVALNVAGKVVRVDPDTGAQCTIAGGLPLSSSLRFGRGAGWDTDSLYVTSFTGTVTRLTP
jgi:sugar lactone lactonase YvrE